MTWITYRRDGAGLSVLPRGAEKIYEIRRSGKRPADMVLVSLIGPLMDEVNPVILARDEDYDWRFLHGLDCLIVASPETSKWFIKRIADAIVAVEPSYAGVVMRDDEKFVGLNLCWGSYKPKSPFMRKWTSYERGLYAGN
jgi:hypothetical protein